ncbi:glycosyltransferase family 2 protein [uncultured Kushneria sp.]|jgi:dolichol-phosphate mannosyltransferase|uniref:glycosyltransferase family 2 protein n=1 Tax=uncultured Kushneria sp. TaxID=905033 RepID=UPI002606BC79|nr:glycosyltransferase family 2 protein [uncultured Kushneria sp.]
MTDLSLSVLIPARNEADNLPHLLDEVCAALDGAGIEFEMLVVNDGSSDHSLQVLTEYAARDERLRVYHHQHSAGQSTSIWQAAWQARGAWLATLDGDGQNDPADLPAMFERAQKGDITLLAGYRHKRNDSEIKRLSSRIANAVRSRLLKDDTPDTGCGIKIFEREAFLRLPYFNHMHRFLPALIRAQGGTTLSWPVNHRARQAGSSNYGTLDRLMAGLLDLGGVMWLAHRSRLPAPLDLRSGKDVDKDLHARQEP